MLACVCFGLMCSTVYCAHSVWLVCAPNHTHNKHRTNEQTFFTLTQSRKFGMNYMRVRHRYQQNVFTIHLFLHLYSERERKSWTQFVCGHGHQYALDCKVTYAVPTPASLWCIPNIYHNNCKMCCTPPYRLKLVSIPCWGAS